MRLLFHKDAGGPAAFQDRFRRVFTIVTRELGIADTDGGVMVGVSAAMDTSIGGMTNGRLLPGRIVPMKFAPDIFELRRSQIDTICHEMTHVKQLLTGEMSVQDRPRKGVIWHGQFHPAKDVMHADHLVGLMRSVFGIDAANAMVPWEEEAYRRAPELTRIVMKELA